MSDRIPTLVPFDIDLERIAERARLRDEFAKAALTGLLACPNTIGGYEFFADQAVRHADALLARLAAEEAEGNETAGRIKVAEAERDEARRLLMAAEAERDEARQQRDDLACQVPGVRVIQRGDLKAVAAERDRV